MGTAQPLASDRDVLRSRATCEYKTSMRDPDEAGSTRRILAGIAVALVLTVAARLVWESDHHGIAVALDTREELKRQVVTTLRHEVASPGRERAARARARAIAVCSRTR
jgi:hypothetical protein